MSDRMIPISFSRLMDWIFTEHKTRGTVFGVRRPYKRKNTKLLNLFGEKLETPFGPAAGPNTQLAQNIAASYYAGSRFFELKTVQKLDGEDLPVEKPCILAEDECYNVEWSTELYVPQAFDEYVKAWWACKLMALEFGLGEPDGFMFNMSVGYDLEGIKTEKIDKFIEGLKNAEDTPVWKECREYALSRLPEFRNVSREDIDGFSPAVCTSITLSTLHGCPPQEIERIASYLLTEKKLNTFIKCNPTLLGYDYARRLLDEMGYDYIQFGDFHFRDDLQYGDAVPMLRRLLSLAGSCGLAFGVKLTNTFPVDIAGGELPGREMYMSGRSLYALTLSVAAKLSHDFGGQLRISYSGGADYFNIDKIFNLGIWPITLATTVLKPGGYNRMVQIAEKLEDNEYKPFAGVDVEGLERLLAGARHDKHHTKAIKAGMPRKKHHTGVASDTSERIPLTDCFEAPCEEGCPIHQDITSYMRLAKEGRYLDAMKVIGLKNPLPFITGTICAHNCMGCCTRHYYEEPVQIRDMKLKCAEGGYEQYLAYVRAEAAATPKTGRRAAVVGAGPAGLACAYFLARAGIQATVFEKRSAAGGIVRSVIPDFRISQDCIDKDVELVRAIGAEILLNSDIGSPAELKARGFDTAVLAVGAGRPGNVSLEAGAAINAVEFLECYKNGCAPALGKNVAVIGGGNTAMDTARAAKRVAGVEKVRLVYRRDRRNMPADEEELVMALEEGVEFCELLSPVKHICGEDGGRVLVCRRMELGSRDASGRRRPVETDKEVILEADTIIAAVGEKVDDKFLRQFGIETDEKGRAIVDGATALCRLSGAQENNVQADNMSVYCIGDGLNGPSTVVEGIRDARKAADSIIAQFGAGQTETALVRDAEALIAMLASDIRADELGYKKGILAEKTEIDGYRCLGCGALCENCVDVCPNRANIAVRVPGRRLEQIVHIDRMCNECGNCLVFCPYDRAPYKDKFTVFMDIENFRNSENQGFALIDKTRRTFMVRLDGRETEEAVYEDSCTLPERIKELIKTVYEDYSYVI